MTFWAVPKYWVAVVTWSDGVDRDIDVVGAFSSYDAALAAVHAHLVGEAEVVMGTVDAGQRRGTVQDANITWDRVVAPVERIQP
jgi:hypothetical protein